MAEAGSTRRLCIVPERTMLHMTLCSYQFGYAATHIICRAALNMGVSQLVFPVYRNIMALLLLIPYAYVLEKKDRPPLTISFLIQFFLIGLIGITFNQLSYLLGANNTTPTFASAIENSVPAVTFLMATLFRLEKSRLDRKDGKAKGLGTLASVGGASVITLYKGPVIYSPSATHVHDQSHHLLLPSLGDPRRRIGHWVASVSPFTAFVGPVGWCGVTSTCLKQLFGLYLLLFYSATFGICSNIREELKSLASLLCWNWCPQAWLLQIAIQIWAVDKGGPVFFSLYLPLQTSIVAIMATILFGEEFYLGVILGALLIIVDYCFLRLLNNEEVKVKMIMRYQFLMKVKYETLGDRHGFIRYVRPKTLRQTE